MVAGGTMKRWWGRILAKLPGAQQWRPVACGNKLKMRRRRPDGAVEYRDATDEEAADVAWWQASSL